VEMSLRHRVVLVYPGIVPDRLPAGASLEVYPVRSIDFTLPALTGGEMRTLFRYLDAFKPDVVHTHTPWFMGAIIQYWAFLRGVPFYFTAHELPSKILEWGLVRYLRGISRTGLLHALTRTYLVTFCRHCTGVMALNRPAAIDIRAIGYRGKLHVIPNGRTLSTYDSKAPADLESPRKILTFMGDFYARKNQKFLVEALAYLPESYELVLIGHDVDHQYRRAIEAVMSPGLRRRVTVTGRIDHERIPEYLARTHLWVSASLMEVQSLAVLEALASGTPVLGLANETNDELVDPKVGIRLPRDATPEQFARAVRSILEADPATYHRMCAAARERVKPFDWANSIAKTEQVYVRALQKPGPSRRGTLALPLLFASAQALLVMIMFLIYQATKLFERFERRTRAPR
jgi:1,2-diacylglycerol 3-alpha-glucosyltransferase